MNRLALVGAATVAVLLGTAGTAQADNHHPAMPSCGGGYVGAALTAPHRYRTTHWDIGADPDGGTLGIAAPRGWSFVRTPDGEGRFHNPAADDLLSLGTVTSTLTPAAQLRARVAALAGTPGLDVRSAQTTVVDSSDQVWSTLTYRWSNMGEPRWVTVRWIAFGTGASAPASLVLTVSGRAMDVPGLNAVLKHVTPTVVVAG